MNHVTPQRDTFERDTSSLLENSVGLNHLCSIKILFWRFFLAFESSHQHGVC